MSSEPPPHLYCFGFSAGTVADYDLQVTSPPLDWRREEEHTEVKLELIISTLFWKGSF